MDDSDTVAATPSSPQPSPLPSSSSSSSSSQKPKAFAGARSGWFIHPDSLLFRWWLFLFVLTVFANVWSVPFRLSVGYLRIEGDFTAFNVTDALFDLVYLSNIAVHTRLAYWDKDGALVTNPNRIWQRYKRSTTLLVDVISVLPIDWVLFGAGFYLQCVFTRLLRLLQYFFVARYIQNLEKSPGVNVTAVRLGKIASYYLLLSHLVGCAWFSFALPDKFGHHPWLPAEEILHHPLMSQYLRALYFALATLSERMEPPNPYYSAGSIAFMILTQVLGVLLLAYIIGNIAFVIDDASETFQRFRLELDYVQRFMSQVRLPVPLQERVRAYYYFTWKRNRGFNDLNMLKDLPSSLRTDVCLQLTASTVGCNPLFQDLEPSFLNALVKELQQRTLAPGEFLCVQGDVGDAMYFIREGVVVITVAVEEQEASDAGTGHIELAVLAENGSNGKPAGDAASTDPTHARARRAPQRRQVQTCVDGDLIGEFCVLLSEQCPVRTASAQAVSYVELYVLGQDSLAVLLSYYPSVEEELQLRATKKRQMVLRKEENIIGLGRPSDALAAATTAAASNGTGTRGSIAAKNDKMKQLLGGGGGKDAAQNGGGSAEQTLDPSSLRFKVVRFLCTHWIVGTPFHEWWCRVIFVVSLWNALVVPYRLAFDFSAQAGAMMFFDYLFDLLLMIHFVGQFFLRQPPKLGGQRLGETLEGGGEENSGATQSTAAFAFPGSGGGGGGGLNAQFETFSEAHWRYFRCGRLLWDLATCFPMDLFMLVKYEMNPWFRLGKVLRFLTDAGVLGSENLQNAGFNAGAVGLAQLVTGALLTTHWASCMYQSFSSTVGYGGEDEWLPSEHWHEAGRLESYLWAQFQTLVLLTGLGRKPEPHGDLEHLYTMFMILLGVLIVAWAVGEIGELIAHSDRFAAEFGRQLLATSEFMEYRRFDHKVQQRVRNYFGHTWSTRHGADPHVAMAGLPDGLRAEIMHHLCAGVLMKVPLFARLIASEGGLSSSSFARHLIARLRFDSFPAGEFVFHAGDVGDSMYIIKEGVVALSVPPEKAKAGSKNGHRRSLTGAAAPTADSAHSTATFPCKILGPGSFFGEVSLIMSNALRTASVRALKPTFLLVLQKDALFQLLDAHPQFKAEMTRVSAERAARVPFLRERGEKIARIQKAAARARRREMRQNGSGQRYEYSSADDNDNGGGTDCGADCNEDDMFEGLTDLPDVFDANDPSDLALDSAASGAGAAAAAAGAAKAVGGGGYEDGQLDISRSQGEMHTRTRDHQQAFARFQQNQKKQGLATGPDANGVDVAAPLPRRVPVAWAVRDAAAQTCASPSEEDERRTGGANDEKEEAKSAAASGMGRLAPLNSVRLPPVPTASVSRSNAGAGSESPRQVPTTAAAPLQQQQHPNPRRATARRSVSSLGGDALSRGDIMRGLERRQNLTPQPDPAAAGDGGDEKERNAADGLPSPRSVLGRRAARMSGSNGNVSIPPSPRWSGHGADPHNLLTRGGQGISLGRQPSIASLDIMHPSHPTTLAESERVTHSRRVTLERLTDSSGAPLSVFAQARMLQASRNIAAAMRNGRMRSEGQLDDMGLAADPRGLSTPSTSQMPPSRRLSPGIDPPHA